MPPQTRRVVDLLGDLREAPVPARDPKDGRVRTETATRSVPKKPCRTASAAPEHAACADGYSGMSRGAQQRLPGRVGCPLFRARPDGGDRAPVREPVLDLERGDEGVGARGVQGRERRAFSSNVSPRAPAAARAAAFHGSQRLHGPEDGRRGLIGGPCRASGTDCLDLVEVAGERRPVVGGGSLIANWVGDSITNWLDRLPAAAAGFRAHLPAASAATGLLRPRA